MGCETTNSPSETIAIARTAETELQIRRIIRLISILVFAVPAFLPSSAVSQCIREDRGDTLPDAPSAQTCPTERSHLPPAQFIILVERRSYFFPDLATSTSPLPGRQKFTLFLNDSISGQAIAVSAASAGAEQGFNWLAAMDKEQRDTVNDLAHPWRAALPIASLANSCWRRCLVKIPDSSSRVAPAFGKL